METGGAAYGTYGSMICHTGPQEIMKIGEANIWAGRAEDMAPDLTWDLRIRLDDLLWRGGILVKADEKAKKLLSPEVTSIEYPATLDIDWPDFKVPALTRVWWLALIRDLKAMGPVNVAVYCYGGHGRTGTALSILRGLTVADCSDPVQWVRDNYCKEAVESWAQMDYIQTVTGIYITSKPSSLFKKWNQADTTTGSSSINKDTTMFGEYGEDEIEWVPLKSKAEGGGVAYKDGKVIGGVVPYKGRKGKKHRKGK